MSEDNESQSAAATTKIRVGKTETEILASKICEEIRDLYQQFKIEVPKQKAPWPESIRSRVLKLWELGLSSHQIGTESGVPVMTLYSWRQRIRRDEKKSGFRQITLSRRNRRTTFQINEDARKNAISSHRSSKLELSQFETKTTTGAKESTATSPVVVSITLPNGIRIDGVPAGCLSNLIGELSS